MDTITKSNRLSKLAVLLYTVTIFIGAFLLFQVQPMFGRFILPWFGGTPEVWTTCMLFFQLFLLAGYAYAHFLTSLLKPRTQSIVHLLFLTAALIALPIIPAESLKPTTDDNPITHILLLCSLSIGLPYFVLSTTGPLIQAWITRTHPTIQPYRFYALSNAGSLLALLSYPFLIEPNLTTHDQATLWGRVMWIFVIACGLCALNLWKHSSPETQIQFDAPNTTQKKNPETQPDLQTRLLWLALPAAACIELLAVTNKITQDIAVIPFFWVLPLCLYLLTFIICFEHQRWYARPVFITLFGLGILGIIYAHAKEIELPVGSVIGLYLFMLFGCCMVCHGELYRLRPASKHLTGFYMMVSAGGAAGGLFVAVVAPLIFNVYHELHLGILAAVLFVLLADKSLTGARAKRQRFWVAALFVVGIIGITLQGKRSVDFQVAIKNTRNFFGVLTVWEEHAEDPQQHKLLLQHGTTFHGLQFQSPEKQQLPTAYYSPKSGIGQIMKYWPAPHDRKIGVVGLGVGTIAAYGQPGDTITFYEINPQVETLARHYFTYLSDNQAEVNVLLGDARLVMEAQQPQQYDILVLDAFSSDAVPTHLLTREAMNIYLKHLNKDGILALHLSTMHLDLQSVVLKIADHLNLHSAWIESYLKEETGALDSDWILLAPTDTFINSDAIQKIANEYKTDLQNIDLWTDDHINLLQILTDKL